MALRKSHFAVIGLPMLAALLFATWQNNEDVNLDENMFEDTPALSLLQRGAKQTQISKNPAPSMASMVKLQGTATPKAENKVQRPSAVSKSGNSKDLRHNADLITTNTEKQNKAVALTDTKAAPSNWHQIGEACILGCVFGVLHVVCPDHLVTVLSLSIAKQPTEAFLAGFIYGGGHSIGILVCACVAEIFRQALGSDANGAFEHWANYCVGLSIIACGLYLYYMQSSILKEDAAGRIEVQACCGGACADSGATPCSGGFRRAVRSGRNKSGRRGLRLMAQGAGLSAHSPPNNAEHALEYPPPLPDVASSSPLADSAPLPAPLTPREQSNCEIPPPPPPFADAEESSSPSMLVSLTVGLTQGLLCPIFWILAPMVVQLGFLGVLIFLPLFFTVSCVGMGLMSMLGGYCSGKEGIGAYVPLKTLYLIGVLLTVSVGITWMVLTYFHLLV